MSRRFQNERLSLAIRVVAAAVGGYILTSWIVAVLALLLPMQPMEAVLTATMVSFAIYAGIVLSVFAIRSDLLMVLSLAAVIGGVRAALWLATGAM